MYIVIAYHYSNSHMPKQLISHRKIDSSYNGAHDQNRTGEPLPYQGSALPTELRGRSIYNAVLVIAFSKYGKLERETRFELATFSLEG